MIRAAVFSWAFILLLAGFAAGHLDYPSFADTAIDLAMAGFISAMLMHAVSRAADILRQRRPPAI
jgi:hypothetical protein